MKTVALDDKYTAETGRGCVTGLQAPMHLPMMQIVRDHALIADDDSAAEGLIAKLSIEDFAMAGARACLPERVLSSAGARQHISGGRWSPMPE